MENLPKYLPFENWIQWERERNVCLSDDRRTCRRQSKDIFLLSSHYGEKSLIILAFQGIKFHLQSTIDELRTVQCVTEHFLDFIPYFLLGFFSLLNLFLLLFFVIVIDKVHKWIRECFPDNFRENSGPNSSIITMTLTTTTTTTICDLRFADNDQHNDIRSSIIYSLPLFGFSFYNLTRQY